MTRRPYDSFRFGFAFAVLVAFAPVFAPPVVHAQSSSPRRASGAEDLVRFALDNYFREIPLDEKRRREASEIVRKHFEASERMKTIEEKNAALPKRRADLRALLRSDAERRQFDRNVTERALP